MARAPAGLLAGLLFGAGLALSGMINPAKVVAFLDIAGNWDPSLAFVMIGAVAMTAAGYQLSILRTRPLFDVGFVLPTRRDIDARLIGGAAIFGIGWGDRRLLSRASLGRARIRRDRDRGLRCGDGGGYDPRTVRGRPAWAHETVSRVFTQLKLAGVITEAVINHIKILKPAALRHA
jgi:hypothetical protein